jgi:signal transduction histidine kinase
LWLSRGLALHGTLMFQRLIAPLNRSIQAKLSVLVAASVASAVLLGAVSSAWREADRQFASKRIELDGVAKALAATVAAPLASGDAQNIGRALTAIGRIPNLNFAQVLDAKGQSLFQFGNGVVLKTGGMQVRANENLGLFSRLNLKSYVTETPVISGGAEAGTLRLMTDLSSLSTALTESILSALFAAVLAAGLGFLVASRLQRSIIYPINDLTAAMQEVQASHDFSRTVPKRAADETGIMVDAFNDMLTQIRMRIARHMEHLEQEVLNRTAELNLAKIAAESANASKSDFLATMSHEIRTPLNGIMVTAELMSTSDLPPGAQRHADTIVSSGQNLLTIINDILDLSKIEAGRLELEAVPTDPSGIVSQVLALFAARAASKRIDLAIYIAPDVPRSISADPVRLTQVLSNLVSNALKFTPEGSVSIEVSVAAAPQSAASGQVVVTFKVIDTGLGIAKDKLDHIFEAFSQADRSTARQFGGTGIGLSISRRLVAAMGGEIKVTSEVGAGSCFYFTIARSSRRACTNREHCTTRLHGHGRHRHARCTGPHAR